MNNAAIMKKIMVKIMVTDTFLKGVRHHYKTCLMLVIGVLCVLCRVSVVCAGQEQDIKTLFQLGQLAFEEERYQDAVQYFERVIELNNSFAGAYHALGLVYEKIASDPMKPLWYFQTALDIDPNFAPSYDMLCRSYYQLQYYAEAEAVCLKALELNPDLISSQLSLAWVYLIGRSDADRAIFYFEKVIDQLNTPFISFGLGMAYAMRGDHGKVLDIVTRLRSDGVEEFAAHLEAFLRSRTSPEKFIPPGTIKDQPLQSIDSGRYPPQADGLYPMNPAASPPLMPVVVVPRLTGTTEVKLKGKVTPPKIGNIRGVLEPETMGGQKVRHPGGLSE